MEKKNLPRPPGVYRPKSVKATCDNCGVRRNRNAFPLRQTGGWLLCPKCYVKEHGGKICTSCLEFVPASGYQRRGEELKTWCKKCTSLRDKQYAFTRKRKRDRDKELRGPDSDELSPFYDIPDIYRLSNELLKCKRWNAETLEECKKRVDYERRID